MIDQTARLACPGHQRQQQGQQQVGSKRFNPAAGHQSHAEASPLATSSGLGPAVPCPTLRSGGCACSGGSSSGGQRALAEAAALLPAAHPGTCCDLALNRGGESDGRRSPRWPKNTKTDHRPILTRTQPTTPPKTNDRAGARRRRLRRRRPTPAISPRRRCTIPPRSTPCPRPSRRRW